MTPGQNAVKGADWNCFQDTDWWNVHEIDKHFDCVHVHAVRWCTCPYSTQKYMSMECNDVNTHSCSALMYLSAVQYPIPNTYDVINYCHADHDSMVKCLLPWKMTVLCTYSFSLAMTVTITFMQFMWRLLNSFEGHRRNWKWRFVMQKMTKLLIVKPKFSVIIWKHEYHDSISYHKSVLDVY